MSRDTSLIYLELAFWKSEERSCAWDQALLNLIYVLLVNPELFQRRYSGPGNGEPKRLLSELIFLEDDVTLRNWPSTSKSMLQRNKNIRGNVPQHNSIKNTMDLGTVLQWLLPDEQE